MADAYGQEAYLATKTYNFEVDKSIGPAPNVTSVELVDGTLFIHSEPLAHSNFNDAYLVIENVATQQQNEILLTEEQLASGIYNDNLSLDNELSYSIKLTNNFTSSISNAVGIIIPEFIAGLEIIDDTQYYLTWEQHPLHGNFDNFKYINHGYNNEVLSADGGQLLISFPAVLGDGNPYYNFSIYRDNYFIKQITKQLDVGTPFELDLANEFVFSETENAYFAIKKVGPSTYNSVQELFLYKLDPDNLSIIQTVLVTNITSGDYIDLTLDPISGNLIIDTSATAYLMDISSLSVINSWYFANYNFGSSVNFTNYRNGYMYIRNVLGSQYFSIYNADTTELIYNSDIVGHFDISDDGQYFYNDNTIYRLSNDIVSEVTTVETGNSIHTIEFLLDQNKCIYSNLYSNPVIYDFNTQTKTIITEISEVRKLNYDKSSGKVLFLQEHSFTGDYSDQSFANVYNLNTQTFKRLEVYDTHYNHIYRYQNDKLIFSGGFYLDEYINN